MNFVALLCMVFMNLVSIVFCERCLDGISHKQTPTSDDKLHGWCSNWSDMACCNSSTTFQFHLTNASWYGFNYDHCAPMSSKCLDRFRQELCLYECDPYLGPWIVKDTSKKIRTERFYNIPLCKSDCDAWFDDCKDDYTCRDNWNKGFVWKNGMNSCPHYEKCQTFKNKFSTAENFCNKIWDGSFRVASDNTSCISFTFDFKTTQRNPNSDTLKNYQAKNPQSSAACQIKVTTFVVLLLTMINWIL